MPIGGAISNAENAKDLDRKNRYQAACHVHVVQWVPLLVPGDGARALLVSGVGGDVNV